MQCLFLYRDSSGRLPTAQDLLRCGFKVSEAALRTAAILDAGTLQAQATANQAREFPLAAETMASYGDVQQAGAAELPAWPSRDGS